MFLFTKDFAWFEPLTFYSLKSDTEFLNFLALKCFYQSLNEKKQMNKTAAIPSNSKRLNLEKRKRDTEATIKDDNKKWLTK